MEIWKEMFILSQTGFHITIATVIVVPLFLQDVHVTGFAAEACRIRRLHNPGFQPYNNGKKTFDKNKDILRHYVDSNLRTHFANILNKM